MQKITNGYLGQRKNHNQNPNNLERSKIMPIHKAKGPRGGKGWQYGSSGKVYPTKKQAVRQMVAIKISQGKIKPKGGRGG